MTARPGEFPCGIFLAGRREYDCTAWGIPLRNIFGWQKPCYLMAEAGYAKTYKELLETTDWSKYGHRSGNPKCANCMVHSGYEPSSVDDTFKHPLEALWVSMGWNSKNGSGKIPSIQEEKVPVA